MELRSGPASRIENLRSKRLKDVAEDQNLGPKPSFDLGPGGSARTRRRLTAARAHQACQCKFAGGLRISDELIPSRPFGYDQV